MSLRTWIAVFGAVVSGLAATPPTYAQKIYWTDAGTDKIQRANLDGSAIEDLVITGLIDPSGTAIDPTAGRIYWTDAGTGKIQRANLDGSDVVDLVTGLTKPRGIALDENAGKMYWTNAGESFVSDGTIQRANLDGSNIEDVIASGLVSPHGIALDTNSSMMYWTDPDANHIQRASLGGISVEVIIQGGDLFFPLRVALDVTAGKLYWTATVFEDGSVERADMDGSNYEPLIYTGTGLGGPLTEGLALDVSSGKMYWTEGTKIRRANLDGTNREDVVSGLILPRALALDLRVANIPALSTWKMLAAALLIVIAGSIAILRKRPLNVLDVLSSPRDTSG